MAHLLHVVEQEIQTIALGQQILASAGMMLVITLTHALGLAAITNTLHLRKERLEEVSSNLRGIAMTAGMALMLLALHTVEIGIFAVFYLAVDAMQTLEEALYYSASAYATLGRTAEYFPRDWRLIGAIEALIGFLMIGWSTAYIVSKADRLTPG